MIIPEKLKLNKFRYVKLPRNADYFKRFGPADCPDSAFSEDNFSTPRSKTEELAELYDKYAEQMAKEQE